MKFENTSVWGFEHAIRGMRNPMNSWGKSDSFSEPTDTVDFFVLGKNDRELAQKLIKAGSEHRKFMRQIFVSVDIVAPDYWFKEFDTYKIGVTENSTSTMHKLATTPITVDCFELDGEASSNFIYYIEYLESLRKHYLETKDKKLWRTLIQSLPMSWLYRRTVTMSYENVLNMIKQRQKHKLKEWSEGFIEWAKSLPYSKDLLFLE